MSEAEIREQLLEALPDAVFVVGSDGGIVFVNAQAVTLFGYERRELIDHDHKSRQDHRW